MGIKRVLKGGLKPPAKHKYTLRNKSRCDRFDLKNFDLRFPHLTSKILSELNPKSLVTFSKVDRYLYENVENQRPVHVLLSRFYPDFLKTNFIQILSRFYPNF